MRDASLHRFPNNWTKLGLRRERANDLDRLVLQADRSRQRDDVAVLRIEQRQLVRQQTPAAERKRSAQGALARPGRGRQEQGFAASLEDGRVNNQELMAVAGDAPVESPLEHRKPLISRQRRKARFVVDAEYHLRGDPLAQTLRSIDADAEVCKACDILDGVVRVVERDAVGHGVQAGANAGDDGARAKAQATSVQVLPQRAGGEFGD